MQNSIQLKYDAETSGIFKRKVKWPYFSTNYDKQSNDLLRVTVCLLCNDRKRGRAEQGLHIVFSCIHLFQCLEM